MESLTTEQLQTMRTIIIVRIEESWNRFRVFGREDIVTEIDTISRQLLQVNAELIRRGK